MLPRSGDTAGRISPTTIKHSMDPASPPNNTIKLRATVTEPTSPLLSVLYA